jgi:hypothetical protein
VFSYKLCRDVTPLLTINVQCCTAYSVTSCTSHMPITANANDSRVQAAQRNRSHGLEWFATVSLNLSVHIGQVSPGPWRTSTSSLMPLYTSPNKFSMSSCNDLFQFRQVVSHFHKNYFIRNSCIFSKFLTTFQSKHTGSDNVQSEESELKTMKWLSAEYPQ